VRRINAITNNQVDFYLKEISEELGLQKEAEQKKAEEKQSQTILLNRVNVDLIVSKPIMKINGTDLHFSKVELGIASDLKSLNKKIKNKIDSGIIFLFTEIDKKTTISVGISDDLISKNLKAGDLVKSIASELQGGGGGREDFAMAGIPLTNADDLKAVVEKIILSTLEEI
jgi:alanyl-tRNA synthetase